MLKKRPDVGPVPGQIITDELIADCARFVQAAKAAANVNQKELARRAGVSRPLVNRLINASASESPRLETLARIARASGKRIRLVLD